MKKPVTKAILVVNKKNRHHILYGQWGHSIYSDPILTGIRIKGDERIPGDGDFVENVLKTAGEALEEKYDLKAQGYDFDRAVSRVAEVLGLPPDRVTAFGKSPQTVEARAHLCFWAQRKLGFFHAQRVSKMPGNHVESQGI